MTPGAALGSFVAGRISFNALRNAIREFTTFAFHPRGRIEISVRRALPRVVITPEDVERAIRRYHLGEVTIGELASWGMVLHNLDAFELEQVAEADADEVWEILGELSLSTINDQFDEARAAQLLERARAVVARN